MDVVHWELQGLSWIWAGQSIIWSVKEHFANSHCTEDRQQHVQLPPLPPTAAGGYLGTPKSVTHPLCPEPSISLGQGARGGDKALSLATLSCHCPFLVDHSL